MNENRTASLGFTLLELLIATTLLLIVTGLGISAFIRFNEKQTLIDAARQLQGLMRSAQTKASVSEVPVGCDDTTTSEVEKLWAYRVSVDGGSPGAVASLSAMCGLAMDDLTAVTPSRSTYQLPANVSASTDYELDFFSLHGGVDVNGSLSASVDSVTITLSGAGGLTYSFDVTKGGEITNGAINDSAQD